MLYVAGEENVEIGTGGTEASRYAEYYATHAGGKSDEPFYGVGKSWPTAQRTDNVPPGQKSPPPLDRPASPPRQVAGADSPPPVLAGDDDRALVPVQPVAGPRITPAPMGLHATVRTGASSCAGLVQRLIVAGNGWPREVLEKVSDAFGQIGPLHRAEVELVTETVELVRGMPTLTENELRMFVVEWLQDRHDGMDMSEEEQG